MTSFTPHEEAIHNQLEYFNELCVIAIQHLMFFFIAGSGLDPELQWDFGNLVILIVALVFAVNFIALIFLTVQRVIFWCRLRKARQAYLKIKRRRGAFRHNSSRSFGMLMALAADEGSNNGGESLNNALSVVAGVRTEPIEVEGSMRVPAKPKFPLQTETSTD